MFAESGTTAGTFQIADCKNGAFHTKASYVLL